MISTPIPAPSLPSMTGTPAPAGAGCLARLYAVTTALSRVRTPADVAGLVLDEAVAALGASGGMIALLAEDRRQVEVIQYRGCALDVWHGATRVGAERAMPLLEPLRTGRATWYTSRERFLSRYPALADAMAGTDAHTLASLPLSVDGRTLGVAGLTFPTVRRVGRAERAFALALAQQCAQALERARLCAVERHARLQTQLLAAVVESSADAIFSETLDGVITSWNAAAERLYGYTAPEIVGRHIRALVPPDRPDDLAGLMERLRCGERTGHFEMVGRHRDGRLLDVSIAIAPLLDASGRIAGASVVARDVSERKRLDTERLQGLAREHEARAHAEAAVQARDAFITIAAHELKSPMTVIRGQVQLLLRRRRRRVEPDLAQEERTLQLIDIQTRRLAHLTAQLLDVSRLTTAELVLRREAVSLGRLLAGPVAAAQAITDRHTVTLAADDVPEVDADAVRLEQVMTNLLDNAIKYSPDGGPIEVALRRPSDGWVEIVVRDHGMGVPPEHRVHMFERFSQAHGGEQTTGMGLGLYVCREIAQLHGGDILAEFPDDGGTRMLLRLPVSAPETAQPPDTAAGA